MNIVTVQYVKIILNIDPPDINKNMDDFSRMKMKLKKTVPADNIRCEISLLQKLPDEIRKNGGIMTLTLSENRNAVDIINISPCRKKDAFTNDS